MKKCYLLLLPALFMGMLLTSCNKDKDKDDDNTVERFSTLSVEDNKAKVEDAGIELIGTMKDMESMETMDVIANLGDILSSSDMKKSAVSKESKIMRTFTALDLAAKRESRVNGIFDALVSPAELSEDPESIQEFWDENVGTYTWNASLEDWDINNGGDKIIFLFPSEEGSSVNDATLTISNYTGVMIENPIDEEYEGDLPASLNMELKVGSTVLITMTYAASYNPDGVPNMVAADLAIEKFKFEVDLTNTSSLVSVNYRFLYDQTVVMDMGASGKGLFTEDNYNEHTETTTHTEVYGYWDWQWNPVTQMYEEVWVEYTETWEETETEFEEIINSASAHFQLYDVALRGDVDIKGLADQVRVIEDKLDNELISDEEADSLSVIEINKYLNLRLVNVKTNEIMAKAEAYVIHEVEWEYEYTDIDFRLTFADGSPIDVETYFEDGFDQFIDELNALINDINSDYDLDIEPVEYD